MADSLVKHASCAGDLEYKIKETRLLEFTDIGWGMAKTCLKSFISRRSKSEAYADKKEDRPVRHTTREWMLNSTEMPAFNPKPTGELSFRPLVEQSHVESS